MKKVLILLLVIASLLTFCSCGKQKVTTTEGNSQNQTTGSQEVETEMPDNFDINANYTAVIRIKGLGDITVDLYAKTAPITVANFVSLAKSGFYNGLTFHRIIKDFMIQGGDPNGDGTGGGSKNIKGEFYANGVENNLKHDRGVISMARSGSLYEQYLAMGYKLSDLPSEAKSDIERAMNSASSQFFIMHKDSPHLDGNYAAFGKVTSGMEIVDKLAETTPVIDNNGTVAKENQPIIESVAINEF